MVRKAAARAAATGCGLSVGACAVCSALPVKEILLKIKTRLLIAALTASSSLASSAPALAGRIPHPSAPAVAVNWCAQPHRHGAICVQVKGTAVVSGTWGSGNNHRLRAVPVPGRFEHQPQVQIHIAGRPGKCIGSNRANRTALVTGCGPGGVGTVFGITPGNRLVSRYWTLAEHASGGDPDYLLTASRHGHLLTYRLDASTRFSQFWAPCGHDVCGVLGVPAVLAASRG